MTSFSGLFPTVAPILDTIPHDEDFSDEIYRLLRYPADRQGFATACLVTNVNGLDAEEFLPWSLLAQTLTFLESVQQCLRCGVDFDPVLGLSGILLPCGHVRQNGTVSRGRLRPSWHRAHSRGSCGPRSLWTQAGGVCRPHCRTAPGLTVEEPTQRIF